MASVKWLTEIHLLEQPFAGPFQTEKYWYEYERDGCPAREPVTLQRVRALITEPAPSQELASGETTVRGVAWSGAAPIEKVEVGIGAAPWREARLIGDRRRYSWQWWELTCRLVAPGPVTLRARATDFAGRPQPERADWNRFGYGNNAIHQVSVRVAACVR